MCRAGSNICPPERRLNHGIGYATAAIELILPTFGAARGLKGKVAPSSHPWSERPQEGLQSNLTTK